MKGFTQRIGEFLGIDLDSVLGTDITARQTMSAMCALALQDDCCQYHQYNYRGALRETGRGLTAGLQTDHQRIGAVYRWVCSKMRFLPDPQVMHDGRLIDTDLLKKPCVIFQEVEENGRATGDCDDYAIFLAGLFKFAGMQPQYVAITTDGKILSHVVCAVFCQERGAFLTVDPQGWKPEQYNGKILRMSV